ncbi:hypothetical protein HanRHA438_Chr11g0503401 [Helianthus annuus]|nr:hypothetical protein HanRHA438_Chr11g0503401 [Helianthus annuus]
MTNTRPHVPSQKYLSEFLAMMETKSLLFPDKVVLLKYLVRSMWHAVFYNF